MDKALFIPFEGTKKNDDGSVNVYGCVTSERLDADGQITDLNWFRSQVPEWAKWSNIREMHKGSAVGVGLSTEDRGDSIWLEAKIVDKEAAIKVTEGVYKGFSYGLKGVPGNPLKVVKDAGAPNGRIIGGALIEISVVDRPANPESSFSVVKNTEVLDKEAENLATLTKAAEMIRSVVSPSTAQVEHQAEPGEAPVQETEKAAVATYGEVLQALVDLGKTVAEEVGAGVGYKDMGSTCPDCGHAPGCGCTGCKGCGNMKTVGSTNPEEDEVMDKAALAEIIKGMTAEERAEVGLISSEDFNALKTTMAEMEKKVVPTGLHLGAAMPTGVKSNELSGLEADLAEWEPLTKADNPQTAQFAQLKVNEINKAIQAATPAPAA